jgi:hypothetical protein
MSTPHRRWLDKGEIMGPSRFADRRSLRSLTAAATVVAALLLAGCGDDEDAGPRVVPADESVGGQTLTDLVAAYAVAHSTATLAESSLVDLTRCDMGASTDTVYFAPTFAAAGESAVTCTMRSGQAVFLAPAGLWCIETDEGPADTACLDEGWNLTSASVIVDGETIDLAGRQVDTAVQAIELPEDNIWEEPAGPSEVIARSQAAVVENLAVGTHEVVLAADFGNGEFAGSLKLTLIVEE